MSSVTLGPMLPRLYRVQRVRREIPDPFTHIAEPEDD